MRSSFSCIVILRLLFFLGIIIASIRAVFKNRPAPTPGRVLILFAGLVIGLLMVREPLFIMGKSEILWPVLIISGALASATMLIPGVPGSAVLIMMGIYDDVLFYLKEFLIGELLLFGVGSLLVLFYVPGFLRKYIFAFRPFLPFYLPVLSPVHPGLLFQRNGGLWKSCFF